MTSLVVLLPLATALLLAVPRLRPTVASLMPLAALPALLAVFALPDAPDEPLRTISVLDVGLDPVGRVFLGFTSALWIASGWYARTALAEDPKRSRFDAFFLLAMAGNFALVLARDIPTFYAGFAVMGFASAGLVLHEGSAAALRAGTVYVSLALLGEILLFGGFVFLANAAGTTEIAQLADATPPLAALWMLLVGFGVKAGALCVHFWLPLAHPAAPLPASAVLSGAMIKAGLLGWLRFLPLGETALPGIGFTMIALGLAGALLSAVVGVVQANAKTVLAYSSIAQMGILTAGVGIGLVRPEAWPAVLPALLIYATHHALAKGALFLGIGPARQADGRAWRLVAAAGLLVPALALAGAPFTSGALAKFALKANLSFLPAGWADALAVLLPIAAVGTTLKMCRFLWLVWPRPTPRESSVHAGLRAPWLFLVGAVLVAVWLLPGSAAVLAPALAPAALWGATWPLVIGGLLAAFAHRLQGRLRVAASLPAGDVVVPLERVLRLAQRLVRGGAAAAAALRVDVEPARRAVVRAAAAAARAEDGLRRWRVGGASLVIVVTAFLLVLAFGGVSPGDQKRHGCCDDARTGSARPG